MSEFKEVWHVWDGASDIPHTAITSMINRLGRTRNPAFTVAFKHQGFGAGGEIVAYTLGQKRRRVECSQCEGLIEIGAGADDDCAECNGTGKVWEYAE